MEVQKSKILKVTWDNFSLVLFKNIKPIEVIMRISKVGFVPIRQLL